MQPVGVLVRVHQRQHGVRVEPLGQRQLDDVAGAGGVGVQLGDGALDVRLGRVARQVAPDAGDAHLGAVTMLAADVGVTARVVADEDRAEPRVHALLLQSRDTRRQL